MPTQTQDLYDCDYVEDSKTAVRTILKEEHYLGEINTGKSHGHETFSQVRMHVQAQYLPDLHVLTVVSAFTCQNRFVSGDNTVLSNKAFDRSRKFARHCENSSEAVREALAVVNLHADYYMTSLKGLSRSYRTPDEAREEDRLAIARRDARDAAAARGEG